MASPFSSAAGALALVLLLALKPASSPASTAVPLTPVKVESVGIGGAGAMFHPAISPHDPKLLFVSCDMSGFYRSQDGGRSWTMLDGHMIQGTTAARVFFHPTDPATVYQYGPGAGGATLRVSHDRGVTWTPLALHPAWGNASLTALEIDPARTSHMVAGASDGLYYSEDSGATWVRSTGASGQVVGLFLDPLSPAAARRCFAATPNAVLRSNDAGMSWTDTHPALPRFGIRHFTGGADLKRGRLALYLTIPSLAVDGHFTGGVYRSSDGRTWAPAMGGGINTRLGKQDEYGAADIAEYDWVDMAANNPDVVYTTTAGTGYWPPYHFTVYRSDDGGRHWKYVFTGDPRFKDRNVELGWITYDQNWGFGGPPLGFAVSRSNPDLALYTNVAIYITGDGGVEWRQVYTAQAPGQGPEGPGQRWRSIGLEVTTNWNYVISPRDPRVRAICYTDIGFERSVDGGISWQWSASGSPWANTFYELAIDPDVQGRVWAAASNQHDIPHWTQQEGAASGLGGGVVVSQDGMKSWKVAGSGLPVSAVTSVILDPKSPPEKRRLWAALWGRGVYRSVDGGATWTDRSNGLGYPGNRNCYRVQLTADGALYCSVATKRVNGNHYPVPGGLWRSRNGGDTWECVTDSLKPSGMIDFAIDPHNSRTIYLCQMSTPAGELGGVYKSVDGGQNWRKLPLKLGGDSPYIHAFAPFINPRDPAVIFVTTEGEGIGVSRDAGESWREFHAIPFMTSHRVIFDPLDPHVIYVTTFGGGVWKVTLE